MGKAAKRKEARRSRVVVAADGTKRNYIDGVLRAERNPDGSGVVHMDAELQAAMGELRERFRKKFGRDPGPNDPVFFDPDSDTPQEYPQDRLDRELNLAMQKAGIEPAIIYASNKTGLMVTEDNWGMLTPEEQQEWDDAIQEYQQLKGKELV